MIKGKYNIYPRVIIIAIAIMAMVGVNGCLGVNKTPKIEVIPASHDFGVIPYEKVEHTFLVKNSGTSPLDIKGVSTSCGCTKGTVESEKVMPGETTSLLVTFDPNLMSEEILGEVLRIVYIKSNDPEQPEVEVEIRANVKK